MIESATLAELFYRPPIALGLVVFFVGLVLLPAWIAARRERARYTALLRCAALIGLVWLLLGPSRSAPGQATDERPPRLAILVDHSSSMAQEDGAQRPDDPPISRLAAVQAEWLSEERMDALRAAAAVEVYAFGEQLRVSDAKALSATADETRLFEALSQIDADASLILSDGHDTTASTTTTGVSQLGRLFAVPVGTVRSAPDIALQAWSDSDRVFEDQSTAITASLFTRGLAGKPALVELIHNGEVIDQQRLTLGDGREELTFRVTPPLDQGRAVAAHHYRCRVELASGGEAYTENNAEDVFIQVTRDRVRVLLIEGEPYWDTRSLSRLIGAHPRFDLTALFSFGDRRRSRILGERFADRNNEPLDALDWFDVVILGRQVDRLVPPDFAEQLEVFVRDGGALVLARGEPIDARKAGLSDTLQKLRRVLNTISPVDWAEPVVGQLQLQASVSDADNPFVQLGDDAVLSRLPGMLAATRIEGRKAASLVVLEQQAGDGPAMAALTTMRVGSGVVMAVLTEGLWRWELLPQASVDAQTKTLYGSFWVRALQWLAQGGAFLPGQDIALELDRLAVPPGDPVTARVSTRYIETEGLDLQLTAHLADGNTEPVALMPSGTPGSYTATFTPELPGVVRFELLAPGRDDLIDPGNPLVARIASVDRSPERRDTSARPDVLKQLTADSGGQCLAFDDPTPLLDYLQIVQESRGADPRVDYDFNHWPAFLWIVGCLGLEWILRRRSGLR